MKQGSITIIGLGESSPNPAELVTNDQVLERLRQAGVDTKGKKGEDTEGTTGIRTRWISKLTSTEHAVLAAKAALLDAGGDFLTSEIGLIHSGGSSPDFVFSACAAELHGQLGIPTGRCEGADISNACSSFVHGLTLAVPRMIYKSIRYGLVCVGESIGHTMNRKTSLNNCLWGDGGGAVLLEYNPEGDPYYGFIADRNVLDGEKAYWTKSRGIGTHPENRDWPEPDSSMEGHEKDIHVYALRHIHPVINDLLEENQVDRSKVWLLPHNGNIKMAMGIGERVGLPTERVLTSVIERGNTSSASIPITLDYYAKKGYFQSGDVLVLAAFGGGMAISIALYRWP